MDDSITNSDTPATGAGPGPEVPPAAQPHWLERVVKAAHDAIDRLAELAAPHAQRLEEGVSSANETLHERADQAREVGQEWADSARSTVRAHPLAAVAAALVAGAVIARLLRPGR